MRRLAFALCVLLLAGRAQAQEDPIGALLDKAPQAAPAAPAPTPAVPAAAPTAPAPTAPAATPPVTPSPEALPAGPQPYTPSHVFTSRPYVPPRSGVTTPTRIDETGRSADVPPSPTDLYFESRVRQSFAAAQGLQGPLDGRWVVRSGGAELYELQLVDRNTGGVEGSWRDPRRAGAVSASGFIESVQRIGSELSVRFQPRAGTDAVQLSLRPVGGGWAGELVERGERKPVTVGRN